MFQSYEFQSIMIWKCYNLKWFGFEVYNFESVMILENDIFGIKLISYWFGFWNGNDIIFIWFWNGYYILVLKYKLFWNDHGVIIMFGC